MAGAIVAIASIAQIGVLSADIVLNETDGEAYYPDIKKFVAELDQLNVEVEQLKKPYEAAFLELSRLKERVHRVAIENEAIYVKLDRIGAMTGEILARVNHISISCPGEIKDVAQFHFESSTLDDIVKYAAYGLAVGAIGTEGVALRRAFYSSETTFQVRRNQIGNALEGTTKTTSRLRLMKVSRLVTAMAVVGVVVAIYGLVRGLEGAKDKRDALEKAVADAKATKDDLISRSAEFNEKIGLLKADLDQSIDVYRASFQWMVDDLNASNEKLAAANPGVAISKVDTQSLDKLEAEIVEIRAKDLGSTEQLDRIDSSQQDLIAHLSATEADFEAAKKEITIMAVITPLAQHNVPLSVICLSLKGLDENITEAQVASIIHDQLHLSDYNPG